MIKMIKMIKMIMMISTDLYPRVTRGPGAGTTCLPRDHRWSGKSDLLGRNSNTVLHLHFYIPDLMWSSVTCIPEYKPLIGPE